MSGKSVLISKELAHPWWTDYWETTVERTHDFFRAYYTNDPEQLRSFMHKYYIDYWLVDREHFTRRFLGSRRLYMEPFSKWISHELQPSTTSLVTQVPQTERLYDDSRYFVVSCTDLEDWLDQRGKLHPAPVREAAL